MAQVIADRRDVDFVLYEQFHVEELSKHEKFAEFNKKTVDLIVSEARNLAVKEILPTQELGDREGVRFENGKVTVPESFKRIYELYTEGEWVAMTEDLEWGGQGMPRTVALAAGDYFVGANFVDPYPVNVLRKVVFLLAGDFTGKAPIAQIDVHHNCSFGHVTPLLGLYKLCTDSPGVVSRPRWDRRGGH